MEVPLQAADEAQVGIGVNEDLDVEQPAERGLGEDQDALHKDHIARLDCECLGGAAVGGEIVDRHLDGLPVAQGTDVLDQKLRLERIWMIEVEFIALCGRESPQILVI